MAVDRYAAAVDLTRSTAIRMVFMLTRLFALAIVVILVRQADGQAAGLACLAVVVFAFTISLAVSAAEPPDPLEAAMSSTRKLLLSIFGFYLLGIVLLVLIFGFGKKNNSFQIQNEFKLVNWVNLGVFSINRAVVYLLISAILTVVTMVWISRRMQARPNKVQTAVETLYSLMRDNITARQHG